MQTEIKIKLLPGLIKWLEGQKHPDGLIMKLLIDYRSKGKQNEILRKIQNNFFNQRNQIF